MPKRQLKIRFHSIEILPVDRARLIRLLGQISSSPEEDRIIQFGRHHYLLIPHSAGSEHFFGLAKERKNNWPHWMFSNGTIDRIQVSDDGSLGELAYFLVLPSSGLLVEIFNFRGPSKVHLEQYLKKWLRVRGMERLPFRFLTVYNQEAYDQFLRMTSARCLEIKMKVANPGTRFIDGTLGSENLERSLEMLSDIGALTASFRISMGKDERSFMLEPFRNLVAMLRRNSATKAIQVKGMIPDKDRPEMVDLIGSSRLVYEADLDSDDGYLEIASILEIMHDGLEHHEAFLRNFMWADET